MARTTKENAQKTRTRIMASALALFSRNGYEHTTFTDIAARLKMTKGAVYWHFKSKTDLLLALVDEMLEKFRRQTFSLLPDGALSFSDLSFPVVADMMVKNAVQITKDAKGTAFFLLLHEQIRWADATMSEVRADLLRNKRFGPWAAFRTAVENDVKTGRAAKGADPIKVASVCVAIWDGLVHAHIAKMLQCDLEDTIRESYDSVWNTIRADGARKTH